ncbi:MAG: beta-hydroxyacyl-ACP dehydratase [Desulfobulbus propionicus]|nr:MAG: beta-hydroxyacyl-ACP dehydratase [Desulfobulbus propionicus]
MPDKGVSYIYEKIPHRPPFLWLDRVVEINDDSIVAEKRIPPELEMFKGHYPAYPLVPGVILCEAVFQAGALLISVMLEQAREDQAVEEGVPVLTRIQGARFKREVRPGDTITVSAGMKEAVGGAWFLKGSVKVAGKVAVQVDFSCALKR